MPVCGAEVVLQPQPVCQVVPQDRAGCLGLSVHRDSEVNPENRMVRVANRGLDSDVDRGFEVREH